MSPRIRTWSAVWLGVGRYHQCESHDIALKRGWNVLQDTVFVHYSYDFEYSTYLQSRLELKLDAMVERGCTTDVSHALENILYSTGPIYGLTTQKHAASTR